ncbi:TPA: LOW QUALITY PROTEIN: hypothetical protein N0F65_007511, partial [Lagenidium giganteum]
AQKMPRQAQKMPRNASGGEKATRKSSLHGTDADDGMDVNDGMDAILDLMDSELGLASNKQDAYARTKFNFFLQRISPPHSFELIHKEEVTKGFVGQFFSFLQGAKGIYWQTSMKYLSSIKRQLKETTRTDLFKAESEGYLAQLQPEVCVAIYSNWKTVEKQAAMMTLQDLETISKLLFAQNSVHALMDRTLMNNQWLSIGKSSDIGSLFFTDLHWLNTFLVIGMPRYPQSMADVRCRQIESEKTSEHLNILLSLQLGYCLSAVVRSVQCLRQSYFAGCRSKTETRIAALINRVLKILYQLDSDCSLIKNPPSHSRVEVVLHTPVVMVKYIYRIWRIVD